MGKGWLRHGELLKLQIIPHLQGGKGVGTTEVKADSSEVIVEAMDEDEHVV